MKIDSFFGNHSGAWSPFTCIYLTMNKGVALMHVRITEHLTNLFLRLFKLWTRPLVDLSVPCDVKSSVNTYVSIENGSVGKVFQREHSANKP